MSFPGRTVIVDGRKIDYAFLHGGYFFSEADRDRIVFETARMHYLSLERKKIRGESFEGVIRTDGEEGVMGGFAGVIYNAEFDTEKGHVIS